MAKEKPKGTPNSKGRSNHSMNPERSRDNLKGVAKPRTKSTIKRLQMYRNFKSKRDKTGKIIKPAPFQSWLSSGTQARVEPNQKWFGNTRVISQNSLQKFQAELGSAIKNPYQIVMNPTKLPVTLLNEKSKNARVHLLDTESYESVFGAKKQRKRPNIKISDLKEFANVAQQKVDEYKDENDSNIIKDNEGIKNLARDWIMGAGQSKRIWNELYKVIDSSDVLLQILDARDPIGTRSTYLEKFLKNEHPHKHLIFILNKVDLVPTWVTQRWVAILSKEYPTVAFHASLTHPFGKGSLINLLRQFAKLHIDKKQISVGFIGYPNVGKSSVINTLRSKKVCKVAPISGETKVWQYITLMRRIYLIDCPGVVYPSEETDTEKVLKGVVRVELVNNPEDYIPTVLDRVKKDYLIKTYKIEDWKDADEFLVKMAQRSGRLLKGGEPDIASVAKMILNDWQRGKLPFFVCPPGFESSKIQESSNKDEELNVIQDFRKIKVGLSYEGDDIRDLESTLNSNDSAKNSISSEDANNSRNIDSQNASKDDSSDEEHLNEEHEYQFSSSGKFEVEDLSGNDHKDKEMGEIKLNSKEKRALERAKKRKKIGSNFYEVTNVKNRNRKKKKL
ncbi:nucleolar GTP-binding protein 2 [Cylas formicarius]|uniref:nucleolar GTP-binding protein 2 n=1 Tax=Cylas formicarius TaxID=197179 RepID=UPI002958C8A2|nr:nucleolar GTP-binding protein 2 [Cylas formicarius]XP_060518157.1 nucleolar GTP-binding protein 2 [Cylas formicarius]XP_060518158.1 nucleolar GTP-binding protein 2 [Cylas formicarius]